MLDGLFRPRSIAVVGASRNPHSIGHIVLRNLLAHGFQGPIFPINPHEERLSGLRCYRSVAEVPDEIDLVNISVNHALVPAVLEECGRKGVKFVIVHSAGFKEVGPEGLERERELVALAHRHGMRLFGPNSQGAQNSDPEVSVYANFTFVPMKPGTISIIAQSGGMGELLKLHLHEVGLGHRLYCSYGNECDLTMPELLEYYGRDPGTAVILMQTESFKDPRAFLRVASEITPRIPILALKTGRTREGSVAVSSHTGTLVDQAVMARAIYDRAGVLGFQDTDEMIKAAVALSLQPLPRGRRIGLITNTGGPGIQAVDEAVDRGLELARWSDAGRRRLAESLYAEASLGNPVDVVATAGPDHFFAATDTLLREEGVDMVMVFFVTAPFVDLDGIARRLEEATRGATKPVVAVVETIDRWAGLVEKLRGSRIPVYEFPEDGVRALAAMTRYGELRRRPADPPPELSVDRAAAAAILARHRGVHRILPQAEAFAILRAYGIATPEVEEVRRAPDLEATSARVGFPCVLKVDSPEIVHKVEAGGVVLGIDGPEALERALARLHERFGPEVPCLLASHRPAGREVIVGATASPGLGTLVMFGLGGILVEVLGDVAFGLAPLGRAGAGRMVRAVRGLPVLEGVRGQAGVDLEALEELLLRASRLCADFPEILELDLNPVLAYPRGTPPSAVDVRLKVGTPA
jgi:acetate---CoA ligase (ADP-forming)